MPLYTPENAPSWVKQRVLEFLNQAQHANDLTSGLVQDADGKGYAIGETVAQRILDTRNALRLRRFRRFEELEAIDGLGADKLTDLLHSFQTTAANLFQHRMYAGVLLENWELAHVSTYFEDPEEFLSIADNTGNFISWVAEQVEQISTARFNNTKAAFIASLLVPKCYLEIFDDPHYGSLAFASWFYQFDADNWFSFSRVWEETEKYFASYSSFHNRLELRLFKGFENMGILVDAVTNTDLPVVVNYAEQTISIWVCQLND